MIVVSNTSPITNLATICRLDLLVQLYGQLFVPAAVKRELDAVPWQAEIVSATTWMQFRDVANRSLVDSLHLELDPGECEAIALAVEMRADLVLLDDKIARAIARHLKLRYIGLCGVLIAAKRAGFIGAVAPILDELRTKAGFWISPPLHARILVEAVEF